MAPFAQHGDQAGGGERAGEQFGLVQVVLVGERDRNGLLAADSLQPGTKVGEMLQQLGRVAVLFGAQDQVDRLAVRPGGALAGEARDEHQEGQQDQPDGQAERVHRSFRAPGCRARQGHGRGKWLPIPLKTAGGMIRPWMLAR